MKKLLICMILLSFFITVAVFAQESGESKDRLYVKSFPCEQIFPTRYGYIIGYKPALKDYAYAYIPMAWFRADSGKANIVYGSGPEFPYFEVTWKNGEFAHVTIYGVDDMHSLSWGVLLGDDSPFESRFNQDTLSLKY
ncbi:MAG: hypothetical protein EHM28_06475 [Spirochaetaceae bacterium]|nr:MAG: hypothetical protein EHM28_06475 [Spirochaetaceae bacterium]